MTLLKALQSHKGGLLQLKTQLYWYGSRSYDNNPGRICLLLDASATRPPSTPLLEPPPPRTTRTRVQVGPSMPFS